MLVEAAIAGEQIVMAAFFDDPAIGHTDDPVTAPDGRKPVGDDQHCAALNNVTHICEDQSLTLVVERAGCLVQNEDGRIDGQCPGDRQPLPLTAGKICAALFNDGIVALRQFGNEFVGA